MQILISHIHRGWPSDKPKTPSEIREYHPFSGKLSECDGIIYKGHNFLDPPKLRSDTLSKLQVSHQGLEKTKRLTRQCIFWPGTATQIEDMVTKCPTCLQHQKANCKEPSLAHQLPMHPWQRVSIDLFDWKGHTHIIVIDYYSRYPEASQLRDTKSKTVISKLKSILGRHGILEVVPDNGLQYSSCEFQQFAKDYDLRHMTTSPRYPQSGGLHERMVQTVKNILDKTSETNQDLYLALLDYRNTPIDGVRPAQALMSHRLRTVLSVNHDHLKPAIINAKDFQQTRFRHQEIQRNYYD